MEVINGKSPIWVDVKNLPAIGFVNKIISESDDFSSIEFEVTKHEGSIVKVMHTVKYKVKSDKSFDTKK